MWRYSGHLMGIPESILLEDEEDALKLFTVGLMCEPPPGLESVVMANALVNAAPLVIGESEPSKRRGLAKYVYQVSSALIGKEMARDSEVSQAPDLWCAPVVPHGRAVQAAARGSSSRSAGPR